MPSIAKLALEDGTVFTGTVFGSVGETTGEVCFNTSMTGYQEILTDPSYCGQIVAMSYPLIGNYGVSASDVESHRPHLAGFVVRESSRLASNYRSEASLESYLRAHNVVGISGIDTRSLVRIVREKGALKGVISSVELNNSALIDRANASPGLVGRNLVKEVVPAEKYEWSTGLDALWNGESSQGLSEREGRPHIVALDFGMKWNIARNLNDVGFRVTVLPGLCEYDEVMSYEPDGIFLSNGPGDPEPVAKAIATIRDLLHEQIPIFGICLGHQLFALASGASTFKLKFGHRGSNQPVIHCDTGRVEITAQNHGFAVDEKSLPDCLIITHRNVNDDTIAGLRHRTLPAFAVQYHPEASSGPHDSRYLFNEFRERVDGLVV